MNVVSGVVRWVGGGLALAFILTAVLTVSQCKDGLREEGRQEVTQAIQQETIDNLLQEREVTSRVLEEREQQRAINETTSKQTQQKIHTAKSAEYNIDSPLPDSITQPLLMQYQAITRYQGGEDAAASGVNDGTGHTRTAQSADSPKSGFMDK